MIVTIEKGADAARVQRELTARGLWVDRYEGGGSTQFIVRPQSAAAPLPDLLAIPGVAAVLAAKSPHPLVDAAPAAVKVGDLEIGQGAPLALIAGPCSVESEEQIRRLALALSGQGARFLRGGAFKPRSSPYAFQGHGAVALTWLKRAAVAHGMRVVTELLAEEHAGVVAEHADLVQIGSRNMHNFALLKAAARCGRPILLKRGMSATITEWLLAAEYLFLHGAPGVVLCERGVRGFDPETRNILDLGAVAFLRATVRLPVVVDPSHAVGRRDLVLPLARASIAAGAQGLMLEVHDSPGEALSDGPQALAPRQLAELLGGAHV